MADSAVESGEATLLALQEACKEREREMLTLVKRLRERSMIIKMKEQKEAELEEKVNAEIAAATQEKDKEVLGVVERTLAEREQLLSEVNYFKQRVNEAQQKLRTGYYEDPEQKKAKVAEATAEHREGRWADWEDPKKRVQQQDASPKHASLEKMTRPKGTFSLRCEKPRTSEHDRRSQFEQRREQQRKLYETDIKSVDDKRKKMQENRQVVTANVRKTKQLEQLIEKERKEKESTLLALRNRLELTLSRQSQFREHNSTLQEVHKTKRAGVKALQDQFETVRKTAPLQIQERPARSKQTLTQQQFLAISEKLPSGTDAEGKARRREIWNGMDINGNGLLSLAEVDKGVRDVLQCDELFEVKPVLMRAFNASLRGKKSEGLLHKSEFRLLLWYLREYLGLWELFELVDASGDRRVSIDEFEVAAPRIREWGVEIEDSDATFRELDRDGGGMILFEEFSSWALERGIEFQEVEAHEEAQEEEAAAEEGA